MKNILFILTLLIFISSCNDKKQVNFDRLDSLMKYDQYSEAKVEINKILDLDSTLIEPYYTRGLIFYYYENKMDSCVLDLNKVLSKYPNDIQSLYLKSKALYKQLKTKEAFKYLELSLKNINQKNDLFFYHCQKNRIHENNILAIMSYCKKNDKEYQLAMKISDLLIKKFPNDAMSYCERATLKLILNDTIGACKDYKKYKSFKLKEKVKSLEKLCE